MEIYEEETDGGSSTCWWEYKYDGSGSNMKLIAYNSDGSERDWTEYDSSGNLTKETNYYYDGYGGGESVRVV